MGDLRIMAFTREHLLLMHTTDTVKLAVTVMYEEYDGDVTTLHQQADRNLSGGLIVKKGVTKRIFVGAVAVDDDASGTIEYDSVTYTIATPALLKACLGKLDLKAKSFDDSAFWNAWLQSDWNPRVVYGPDGAHRITQWQMVER